MNVLLKEEELGKMLQVSRTTLWDLRRRHRMPFTRIGKQVRYRPEEIDAWLSAVRNESLTNEEIGNE